MRFGIYVPTFGPYDVPTLAALAADAEAAGWDGVFLWDHILWAPVAGSPLADTTVALTAIALATERVRFGALVTPLARRRPWKLAKETATLDRLSGGRLVVGAGLGAPGDLAPFGEDAPPVELAARLDEGLDVVAGLWAGEPVAHHGRRFRVDAEPMLPTPAQRPRIPVWVAGFWPNRAPFRRAARWDGALPLARGHLMRELTPDDLRRCRDVIAAHRTSGAPFDLVAFVPGRPRSTVTPAACERAGATWWVAAVDPLDEPLPSFRARVRAGPPA